MTLGSHVLPSRQTGKYTPRLASARRAPLRQFKRCMAIAVLPIGLIPTRCVLVMTAPDLWPSLVQGRISWWATALRCPCHVSHPWRCAQQQPPVAYFLPLKPLRQQRLPSTSHLFGSTRSRRRIQRRQIYGLQFHPTVTTADSGNCLLPPPARGSLRQNLYKTGCLIQAVLKVVSAPFPVLGTWRVLLCGEVIRFGAAVGDLHCFLWLEGGPRNIILQSAIQATRPLFFQGG